MVRSIRVAHALACSPAPLTWRPWPGMSHQSLGWRVISWRITEGLRPTRSALRTWDKPASNPTIIAARSQTLSIRQQLTTNPSPTALLPHESLTPHDTADQHWSNTRKRKNSGLIKSGVKMERATGIEPASEAWEASILPMNYARNSSSRRNRPVDHIVTPDGRATGVGWAGCGSAGRRGR